MILILSGIKTVFIRTNTWKYVTSYREGKTTFAIIFPCRYNNTVNNLKIILKRLEKMSQGKRYGQRGKGKFRDSGRN